MIELHWMGPYAILDHDKYPNYRTADEWPGFDGLYCWSVEVHGTFLPTYIGKSHGSTTGVVKRVSDEAKDSLKGKYMDLVDVPEFRAGRRLILRPRFSDASEKRGENNHIHAQHLDEYRAIVEASVVFFARLPDNVSSPIRTIERSTIGRVQASGLDVVPQERPERGHYATLLTHARCDVAVEIAHRCKGPIRGLT